jgi:U3 small nucleolar RNA-associated protein 23
MRHLYASSSEPGMSFLIDKAKLFERRRCNHLPEDYPVPLSTAACLASVVDPKDAKSNKHRYVVASQDLETRKNMRSVKGVPLVYINRSVMIMEPMAGTSADVREREEKSKFRDGLRRGAGREIGEKRKRDDEDGEEGVLKKKKTGKGPKGPNPLAVKKAKKKPEGEGSRVPEKKDKSKVEHLDAAVAESTLDGASEPGLKRKRRRKHKAGGAEGDAAEVAEKSVDDQAAAEPKD